MPILHLQQLAEWQVVLFLKDFQWLEPDFVLNLTGYPSTNGYKMPSHVHWFSQRSPQASWHSCVPQIQICRSPPCNRSRPSWRCFWNTGQDQRSKKPPHWISYGLLLISWCYVHVMQIVFSEAFWVGLKEENPQENRLPLPQELQNDKIHEKYSFTLGAQAKEGQ